MDVVRLGVILTFSIHYHKLTVCVFILSLSMQYSLIGKCFDVLLFSVAGEKVFFFLFIYYVQATLVLSSKSE